MRRREEVRDSRVSQRAVDLFRLGKKMSADGVAHDAQEMNEVALGLHRELKLRPWQDFVLDFELYTVTPPNPPTADYFLVEELHRRLVAAA